MMFGAYCCMLTIQGGRRVGGAHRTTLSHGSKILCRRTGTPPCERAAAANIGANLRSTLPAFIPSVMLPALKGRVVRQIHDACLSTGVIDGEYSPIA
ncbi:unnamed protein product [Closterium sp. Yama58-4]|nr:unnamed protein product [Closterium sp. Yama58-4]